MSVSSAQLLLKKVTEDATFRHALSNAPTQEDKRRVITNAGFGDVTKEDIAAAAPSLQGELSDAELEAVAGGRVVDWIIAVSTVTIAAATAL